MTTTDAPAPTPTPPLPRWPRWLARRVRANIAAEQHYRAMQAQLDHVQRTAALIRADYVAAALRERPRPD